MNMSLSRKERRREGQSSEFYQTMRKSAAVVGTTITACSVVAPLLTPVQADAVENTVVRSNFAALMHSLLPKQMIFMLQS